MTNPTTDQEEKSLERTKIMFDIVGILMQHKVLSEELGKELFILQIQATRSSILKELRAVKQAVYDEQKKLVLNPEFGEYVVNHLTHRIEGLDMMHDILDQRIKSLEEKGL